MQKYNQPGWVNSNLATLLDRNIVIVLVCEPKEAQQKLSASSLLTDIRQGAA